MKTKWKQSLLLSAAVALVLAGCAANQAGEANGANQAAAKPKHGKTGGTASFKLDHRQRAADRRLREIL
ncbi:hypothetical protein HMSSN139_06920 [Paenibacillus sp. HMSSN-139]|nr:hypothetical protein HMSSN139_06920 [Paenibacillus sp. HMSSN-139]